MKQAVKLEAQGFGGVLQVMCIKGGPITQLEAQEMARIMEEATRDCAKSDIILRYTITEVSYSGFVQQFAPQTILRPEPEPS